VWQLAADSRYESAGLPALTIVLVAMIPVVLLFRGDAAAPSPTDDGSLAGGADRIPHEPSGAAVAEVPAELVESRS
jgi:hypothetical protein